MTVTAERKGLPVLGFQDAAAWEDWLAQHCATAAGLWLKLAKKGSGVPCLGKQAAIEAALAHGWIDGQLDKLDERHWLVRFTRRKPGSRWSEINRATAERLIAEGRMAPAGLAEVEAAKHDGRWARAYPPPSRAEIPADLQAALDAELRAKAFFATLSGANRYAVLYRVQDAKKPETRAARIGKFVAMLAEGRPLHPAKD